ncbi:phytanoyl-CoA dioxygenase family protein [Sulfitobacter albidus]|uniref:Phytanoyl-CoA dioxygenase family protein n=1 Tax=Sulfitobacter albidus TaxID=2829501 RepID=A0A975JGQ8_9RHOB|nr:phytanoyl-CoA dioxygenase family protein [Sulfitobacter albidus]QUJ78158.1 phytanoyl-CoA dioxygenase family protein [Sulfitobacter albidus]
MKDAPQSFADRYAEAGFVAPIDILDAADARALRDDYEAAETELEGDAERLGLLKSYPDRLLPSFDAIIRHPALIAAASEALGPDLMVWSGALFIKEPQSEKIVSWHQDLTYWGLDDAEETTLWLALSHASEQSGCMSFVPGSHKQRIVPHRDTFDARNLLSRGQEIAVEVRDDEAVAAPLRAGQASMHHGHLFHASGPNRTDDRRIGAAIRFIKPAMRQQNGAKSLVTLVAGRDDYGHFTLADRPRGRLHPEDFALCREDAARRHEILFEGVTQA